MPLNEPPVALDVPGQVKSHFLSNKFHPRWNLWADCCVPLCPGQVILYIAGSYRGMMHKFCSLTLDAGFAAVFPSSEVHNEILVSTAIPSPSSHHSPIYHHCCCFQASFFNTRSWWLPYFWNVFKAENKFTWKKREGRKKSTKLKENKRRQQIWQSCKCAVVIIQLQH